MKLKLPAKRIQLPAFEVEQYSVLPEEKNIIVSTVDASLIGGKGVHKTYNLNHISVSSTDVELPEDIEFEYSLSRDIVVIVLVVEGNSKDTEYGSSRRSRSYAPNEFGIVFRSKNVGGLTISGGERFRALRIVFEPNIFLKKVNTGFDDLLQEFARDIEKGNTRKFFSKNREITADMHYVINQIMNTEKEENFLSIFLESKALELISLILEDYHNKKSLSKSTRVSEMYEKVMKAKEILDRCESGLDIKEVALAVGTNQTTLQQEFRKCFNTSVAKYWKHQRMQQIHAQLQNNEIVPKQAAHNMGYKHTHHFAKAFEKEFGYTPYSLLKKSSSSDDEDEYFP